MGIDLESEATEVDDGYFSIDRKGTWTETEVNRKSELRNQASRDNAERAYNLIMRDKEKQRSFETKPSLFGEDLRGTEGATTECGKTHFRHLSTAEKPIEYVVVNNFDDFAQHW